jgi:acetolactate synthase regulatory subunit
MQHHRNTDLQQTYCFSVRAGADPSVLPRLLEVFAKRGMIPAAFHSRCDDSDAGGVQVDIEANGLAADLADYMQRCMRRIVGVELVLLSTTHTLQLRETGPVARAG